jgi:hypothetical protein
MDSNKSSPAADLSPSALDGLKVLEPAYFEALLEALSDQELGRTVLARMDERAQAVDVDIDAI